MSTPASPADRNEPPADDVLALLMELTGDIAVLPAGSRLADEKRSGHQCFVILDGGATVERNGRALCGLGSGAFVGEVSPDGGPLPPAGVTVRLETRSRVLVLDSVRLAAAVAADPKLAAAWRSLASRTLSTAACEPRPRTDRVMSTGMNHGGTQ
jgi:CRP-like cAMP-binding protein